MQNLDRVQPLLVVQTMGQFPKVAFDVKQGVLR